MIRILENIKKVGLIFLMGVLFVQPYHASAQTTSDPPKTLTINEHCVVSVLNRTVKVQANGSWVLPNVPANFGKVRVRATCMENGVTTSGQSDFIRVPANGAIRVPDIRLNAPEPIPARLTLTSPVGSLAAIGATAQLVATATYPGGKMTDVSQGSSGTNYTVQ